MCLETNKLMFHFIVSTCLHVSFKCIFSGLPVIVIKELVTLSQRQSCLHSSKS